MTFEEVSNSVSVEPTVDELVAQGRVEAVARAQVRKFLSVVPDLLDWLATNGRVYPWRQTTDPWRVYMSEILLQRTRADAVESIYDDFFQTFPDPESILLANEESIYELVRPLGFGNQRTRTLRDAATIIREDYGGQVPEDLDALQRPWRAGPYCARATLLFAFGVSIELVDTNFVRVFSRVFDYEMPSQPHKRDQVYQLIRGVTPTDPELARAFNLAILDIGAVICEQSSPECYHCPLREGCAYPEESQNAVSQ
ncbi:hypothetical protein [Natrialba sp. PRR66]|uniref:hypothetical protein n=1 Tax=Natrialba sp. PRR66 TaxID=3098146 RepID=UPI002B1D9F8E|nr:hypothetical protein [Natrialba sp. PRR66]